uniref:Uncharacterized protein n=1 Tax=Utricularia reniformis TaxID=192314 RepID=A0A1Y0B1V2_9LAMI|nr:hypothetical protein AEK19_MT1138 [Utricularia reniformis]ART31354.1 hypothetical protein AEK19_MT1138 [Utricularia reniformis]
MSETGGIAAAVTLLETTRRRLSLVYMKEAECWDRTTYLCIDPTPVIERSKPAAKLRKSQTCLSCWEGRTRTRVLQCSFSLYKMLSTKQKISA